MKTNKILPVLFILLIGIIYGCSGVSPDYRKYQDQLRIQIREMSNTLDAGHNAEFLSKYADPSYIKSMGGVDAALLQFSNKRQQALYTALKVARNVEPLYNEKSKTMTYITDGMPQPVTFKMVDNQWYLTSDWFR